MEELKDIRKELLEQRAILKNAELKLMPCQMKSGYAIPFKNAESSQMKFGYAIPFKYNKE